MPKFFTVIILLIISLNSCISARKTRRSIDHIFTNHQLLSDHHTGFSLYDPVRKKILYEYNANHFFTPASNTKIITLFSALVTLPDSLPSLKYAMKNDTLYFWGLGDPTTLNPGFGDQDDNISFISRSEKNIVWCKDHFRDGRFGEGWAWDDYLYSYQAEKSSFPLFGNLLHLQYHPANSELILYPNFCDVNFKKEINQHAIEMRGPIALKSSRHNR
ncbi:MAG: D-alanyl-D-alanine carboxypeptidase [Saprospiraceae bacterium]|nr:D-alanyl-D-alanine carboxypeptidase [Saprospiraceae bacterium]